ncbi:sensor histidine kinase [Streptosporangium sp. NPDC000509]|uniref:sensor histidine kinase n=1 Tax=Streptosporangium sp. NPDC000509 TaxID=3366186 RepID=UPI0036A39B0A
MRVARTFMEIARFLRRPRVFDTTLVIVLFLPALLSMAFVLLRTAPLTVQDETRLMVAARLTVTGEPVELPAAVDHAVYRIVQEALTNTRKHAVSARTDVRLTYEPAAVEVEVLDDGLAEEAGTPGFGLSGMAERVALCGGRLSTGPRPEGGFRVYARIPLERS